MSERYKAQTVDPRGLMSPQWEVRDAALAETENP